MRLIGLLISIVLATLAIGCGKQPTTPSAIVKKGGVWAAPIPIAGDLYTIGDGEKAWVWSYDPPGLYLVNPNGEIFNKDKPFFDKFSGRDATLYKAKDGKHAWVKIEEKFREAIYVIDTSGTVRLVMTLDNNLVQSISPFANGTAAIAFIRHKASGPSEPNDSTELRLLKDDGSNFPVNMPTHGALTFYPIGDSEDAWLIDKENVYVVNSDGKLDSFREQLPDAPKIRRWTTNDDDRHMWIEPEGPGLLLFSTSLNPRLQSIKAFANGTIDMIVPGSEANAWIVTQQKIYYIEDSSGFQPTEIRLPQSAKVDWISPEGKSAWIVSDKEVYFVQSNGNVVNVAPEVQATGMPYIRLVGDGKRAWLIGLDKNDNTLFLVDSDGKIEKRQKSFRNDPDLKLFPGGPSYEVSQDGTALLAVTQRGLYVYDSESAAASEGKPILGRIITANQYAVASARGSTYYRSIDQAGRGKRFWAHSNKFMASFGVDAIEGANYIVGTGQDLSDVTIAFGSEKLSIAPDYGSTLRVNPTEAKTATFKFNWRGPGYAAQIAGVQFGKKFDEKVDGRVDLQVLDGDTRVAYGSAKMGDSAIPIIWESNTVKWNQPYTLTLRYVDKLGSDVYVQWAGVLFEVPLLQRKWFKTVLVYLVVILLLAVTVLVSRYLRPVAHTLSRWLPFALYTVAAIAGKVPADLSQNVIDGTLLLILLGATVLLCVPIGILSPPVFRSLAQIAPFHLLVAPALMLPFVRRRVLGDYVSWLAQQIMFARIAANNESYVPIPAEVTQQLIEPALPSTKSEARTIIDPAEMICTLLTSSEPKQRANVLVESPGGRGKSALIRQVVIAAIDKFRQNPQSPLPVLIENKAGTIEENIARSLGRFLISNEMLAPQLKAGDFFIVMDGLSESSIKSDSIRDFIKGPYGQQTAVLFSSRNDEHRRAFISAHRWMILEPRRLDDESLEYFEKVYIEEDEKRTGKKLSKLTPALKAACQGADGLYLPILIRLAILASGSSINSVADLYEATFRRLLKTGTGDDERDDRELLDDAASMCVETYWHDGHRTLAYASAPSERYELLDRLKEAGILVPVEERLDPFENPSHEVRFFHDSMQSYLTARGLFNRSLDEWLALERAAGNPVFVRAQSDLLTSEGSEIFQMCLDVFRPKEKLRGFLKQGLLKWAERYSDDLTINNIYGAAPRELEQELRLSVQPDTAVAKVLRIAVKLCEQSDEQINGVHNLAIMYSRIAPLVWPRVIETEPGGK